MIRLLCLVMLAILATALQSAPARATLPTDPTARQAVERGVAHLRKIQAEEGNWPHQEIGATALAALALLECEVPANDPAVRKAAGVIRRASLRMTTTYSLALSLLFLDRLGEPIDVALIEIMAYRLLAGQNNSGGWGYPCIAEVNEADIRALEAFLRQRAGQLAKPDGKGKPELPREVRQQLTTLCRPAADVNASPGDNSNTQFAALALWVAHRHGVPIDVTVGALDRRFRVSQNTDGGWAYQLPLPGNPQNSTPTMTCAGLLALAVAQGNAREAAKGKLVRDLTRDASIRPALLALGTTIDHPTSRKVGKPRPPVVDPQNNGRFYYFLWSLERVGMIFGLETVGGKDWYAWGTEILVANQREDGGWQGEFAACGADTCFALMFLVRANLARDLTAALRGGLQDPGEVVLRGGGVDPGGLQTPRLGPALEPHKPNPDPSKPTKPSPDKPLPSKEKPPVGGADAEVSRLTNRLVEARGGQQNEVLTQLRDGKGPVYTLALANAIHQLSGEAKSRARDALAARLTRMSSATLADKLEDEDLEVRRGAALAVAMKEDRAHFNRLIRLLEDPETPVVRAAHAALKSLSGQDFGPAPDATRAERTKSVAAWKAWVGKQK